MQLRMTPVLQGSVIFITFFILSFVEGCSRRAEHDNDNVLKYTAETSITQANEKVWLFAVDGRKKPYSFMDDNGQLIGFDVDLISKVTGPVHSIAINDKATYTVCQLASKSCKVVLAEFTECAFTSRDLNLAGRGLMAEWFDGCPSYTNSIDRSGAFDFTDPYLGTASSFTVLPGNPSKFNPNLTDYSSFTLTHLTGAVSNARCLSRLGKKFKDIIIADNLPDAKDLLLSGKADVLFSPRTKISDLEVLPQRVHCEQGGAGVMTKKGSSLSSWWNPAFRTFVSSDQFGQFCHDSDSKYGASFKCLISPGKQAHPVPQTNQAIEKTWLFAVSGRRKPFNFLDDQGQLDGFDVDFIQSVCKTAGKRCDVVLGEFTECTFTNRNINYPGRGLMDNWFDACPGYVNSVDRQNGFDFTDAYLKSYSTFTVLTGNPSGFDPSMKDYSNFTFTHLTGAYTNAACLKRLKKTVKKIVIAADLPDAKRLLANREADVLFSPRGRISGLSTFPDRVHCELTGTSVMVKKGSPLVSWWNKAFTEFVKQGDYLRLCQDGIKKYSFPIKCFPPDELSFN